MKQAIKQSIQQIIFSALTFNLNINNPVKARPDRAPESGSRLSFGYIEHVFESNQLRPGDVLFVHGLTIHAARPNVTRCRVRLSVDYRYRPASELAH